MINTLLQTFQIPNEHVNPSPEQPRTTSICVKSCEVTNEADHAIESRAD
jgi:hypothetical protein